MYKIPNLQLIFKRQVGHPRPVGGKYSRPIWVWMVSLTAFALVIVLIVDYRLYSRYTAPITISKESATEDTALIDKEGLERAVTEIVTKEEKFNLYLANKVEIADPAK